MGPDMAKKDVNVSKLNCTKIHKKLQREIQRSFRLQDLFVNKNSKKKQSEQLCFKANKINAEPSKIKTLADQF
jgi:actin-related protein